MEKDWVRIYSTQSEPDAVLIKQHLENNGIEAITINKQDSLYKAFGEIEVYVLRLKVIKAKRLLEI